MKFSVKVKVLPRHLDANGRLMYPAAFEFMEAARLAYLEDISRRCKRLGGCENLLHLVVHANADFRKPGGIQDLPLVRVWPISIGRTSYVLRYEIQDQHEGVVKAVGETVVVCVHKETHLKHPIPPSLKQELMNDLPKEMIYI